MTLGSVFANGSQIVLTVGKDAVNAIPKGSVCIVDTSTTPFSYKLAPASAGNKGPFVVCVNKDALAADTAFAAAFPGTLVAVKAQGAIPVGSEVQASATAAGSVAAFVASTVGATFAQAEVQAAQADRLRVVGRYIGHENEMAGNAPATPAADGDSIVIRIGGN
jgi:hypothetical protein